MSNFLNLTISSIFFEGNIKGCVQISNDQSIRASIKAYLDFHHISHNECAIILSNIDAELRTHSFVDFLTDESLEFFADEPVKNLTYLFNISRLILAVDIGGIGGNIAREDGITYCIHSRNEHLPKHVHCIKQSKQCKCIIDTLVIEHSIKSHTHFSAKEQSEIRNYVKMNQEYILQKWAALNPNLI